MSGAKGNEAKIDSRYTDLIRNIYQGAILHVKINEDVTTKKIPIQKGVRQGDSISPKLFTLALEDLIWEQKGVNVDGKFLSHLRFANDIVFMSTDAANLKLCCMN